MQTEVRTLLAELGVTLPTAATGSAVGARTPITGETLASIPASTRDQTESAIGRARLAFEEWRGVPGPQRGELVRTLGEELRTHKEALGRLVTIETGKIASEGLGEVQEMIDICTFAAGLARQLCGLTIASERFDHRMMETWHPLGVVGIISAFNFPVAVWSWNAALALVCGNSVIWKPSEKTPLCALATHSLFERACRRFGSAPTGLASVLIGGRETAAALVEDGRVPLVSATGSTAMGRDVAPKLAARFARALLELGGNNCTIVCPSADLGLAVRAIAFSAMGTAGQRCTSLRRLMVHGSIYNEVLSRLKPIYASATVGDPRLPGTLVGPLIDSGAYDAMQRSLSDAEHAGGLVHGGGRVAEFGPDAHYVRPALVEMPAQDDVVRRETFAPILYVMKYDSLDKAIQIQNDVPQGLSSSIFTTDLREAEFFLSARGSDCGIANVNIGPSGAEIGGAFGGEKETGGGRESGSDSWKAYMRRATNTINYGSALPLAQGVKFDIDV